jgi:hypothetical protein
MADIQVLEVLPLDLEQTADNVSVFKLSDVDRLIPARYNKVSLIYALADDSSERELFISHLRSGLQNVLTNIPIMGARLHGTADGPELRRSSHEPLAFYVRRLDSEPQCPSYAELSGGRFNPDALAAITPRLTTPDADLDSFRRDDGAPVVILQANFIRGGWILLFVKHHFMGDGKSLDHMLSLWAASTRAAMAGQPMPVLHPNFDRAYFNAASLPGTEETEELKKRVRAIGFHPLVGIAQQFPPAFDDIQFKIAHFTTAACTRLKALCKPPDGDEVGFVSSYDCVSALAWRAMVRAKLPRLDALRVERGLATTTKYLHPVGTRGRFGVPDEYFGNAFVMAFAEQRIDALLAEGGLAAAARAVRQSSSYVVESSVPDIARVLKGIEGQMEARWLLHPHDILGTSWTTLRVFSEYDFGRGLPVAIRPLPPSYPGSVRVLPADRIDGKSDGLMVHLCLERENMERLEADPEYQAFCSVL